MLLELDGCTVRSWRAADAPSLARYADDRDVARNLRDGFPHPYTRADADAFLAMALGIDLTGPLGKTAGIPRFKPIELLTVDGKVQTGVRISESEREIVLRNLAEPKPIKIKQGDVEEVIESKVSLMPANLASQLKSRKEFDDLMRYIIETRKR